MCVNFKLPLMFSGFSDLTDEKKKTENSSLTTSFEHNLSKAIKSVESRVIDILKP